jgi:hypothetical protein
MNIRPGVTTAKQAMTLLQTNEWVKRIVQQPTCLTWEWSGTQPNFMLVAAETERPPSFNHVCHNRDEDIIRQVWFAVKGLNTGEVILTNGLPERMYVTFASNRARYADVYLAYFHQNIVVRARIQCPMHVEGIWHSIITEIFAVSPLQNAPYDEAFSLHTLLNDRHC